MLEQETLADFIKDGTYERYLRRVRRRNAARLRALLDAIDAGLSGRVEVTGENGGAHLVLWPIASVKEEAAIKAAAEHGVGIYGIAPYFLGVPVRSGFLLGYSRLTENELAEGVRRLSSVL
ncbi:MAG TPA: hypothetical protein VHT24_06080 [Pseudacidobacterium sp.]|jgi:GntR family transcriptional regulator/MocR family aminotransferase|nr:hypothetical protein [Pseudacidobacterium sp.]